MKDKNPKKQALRYISFDLIAALFSWSLFYFYRKIVIMAPLFGDTVVVNIDNNFYLGGAIVPLFWLFLYYISGEYQNIYKKSRLQELGKTLYVVTLGVVVVFFILILDDTIVSYKSYYSSFFFLWSIHFILTYTPRVSITWHTIKRIRNREIGFTTLLVGSGDKAFELYLKLTKEKKSSGNDIIGFVNSDEKIESRLSEYISRLGSIDELVHIINSYGVEEVIIAVEENDRKMLQEIIVKVKGTNVDIKAIPNLLDMLSGSVKISSIYGVELIEIPHNLMSGWQTNLKRVIDILLSIIGLFILSPLLLFITVGVKLSSKGSVLYSQKRMGRYCKSFSIYKFRSMYVNAEENGPELSSKNDTRVTPFGRFIRRFRFDELPQFYNVLLGDMSLVGPRPEREFYVNKIVERAPHYTTLFRIRPGITSWGQVKFGYAENVDEMIDRLKFDIIYLENMSLYVDLKIMIYTVRTVFQGKGK